MAEVRLLLGDCLHLMREIPDGSIDAVVTDPPYSSGGMVRSDRTSATNVKYARSTSQDLHLCFSGDSRDQRAWLYWCALWISECHRIVKPSGYFLMFTDWRQLPQASDALQCGEFVWRGIIPWDKTDGARAAHTGLFRHQCEYVVWGTKGVSVPADWGGPWSGCFRYPVLQSDKYHQTGKPTALMRQLVECAPPGGIVFDPFTGSGTTGVAALLEGRCFLGIEKDPAYFAIAERRIADARYSTSLFDGPREAQACLPLNA